MYSILDCHQKYYAHGKAWVTAVSPTKFEPKVSRLLRLPDILTIKVELNSTNLFEALVTNDIPLMDAQAIVKSVRINDEVYLVPKE
jgi:hypothetical protein